MSKDLDPDQAPKILSGLNWVQKFYKDYQQTTPVDKNLIWASMRENLSTRFVINYIVGSNLSEVILLSIVGSNQLKPWPQCEKTCLPGLR